MELQRGSLVKSTCCSCKVPKFCSQHPHDQDTVRDAEKWVAEKLLSVSLLIKALFEICTISDLGDELTLLFSF